MSSIGAPKSHRQSDTYHADVKDERACWEQPMDAVWILVDTLETETLCMVAGDKRD
jgi:hypothetical protein